MHCVDVDTSRCNPFNLRFCLSKSLSMNTQLCSNCKVLECWLLLVTWYFYLATHQERLMWLLCQLRGPHLLKALFYAHLQTGDRNGTVAVWPAYLMGKNNKATPRAAYMRFWRWWKFCNGQARTMEGSLWVPDIYWYGVFNIARFKYIMYDMVLSRGNVAQQASIMMFNVSIIQSNKNLLMRIHC